MLTAGWSCLANDIELFTPPVCLTDCKKLFIKLFYLRKTGEVDELEVMDDMDELAKCVNWMKWVNWVN